MFVLYIVFIFEEKLDVTHKMPPTRYSLHPSDISFIINTLPNNKATETYLQYSQKRQK